MFRQANPAQMEEKSEVQLSEEAVAARKVAREAALRRLAEATEALREEKEELSQGIRTELVAQLSALLPEEEAVQPVRAEGRTEAQKVAALRNFLRDQVMARETAATKLLCDKAFRLQLLLAELWPVTVDENGDPIDAITQEVIEPKNRIETARGDIMDKEQLKEYFLRTNAYYIAKEVSFRVMTSVPTLENLPVGTYSTYVLLQPAPGQPPTAVYFVDRADPSAPTITQINFSERHSASTFAAALYPRVHNHVYQNEDKLKAWQQDKITSITGYAELIKYRNHLGGYFSPRELAYFKEKGVNTIKEANQNLWNGLGTARVLGQSGERIDDVLGMNFGSIVISPLINLLIRSRIFRGFAVGAALGGLAGYLIGSFLAIGMLCFAIIAFLTPASIPALLGVGMLCGLIESRRRGGTGFLNGLAGGFTGAAIVFLAAYVGPLIIAGLGAASVISSASVAAATGIWTLVQPFIPVAVGLIAAAREYFTPGAMLKTFERIQKATLMIPAAIAAVAFGLAGGVLGLVASIFTPSLRGRGPAPLLVPALVDQQAGVGQEAVNDLQPRLSPNAQMHQVFGQPGEPLSPRTQAAITAALQEDGQRLSPRSALLFQQQLLMHNQNNQAHAEASVPADNRCSL